MNKSIKPIKGFVLTKFLYNGEETPGSGQYTPCIIIGICTYPDQAVTFTILLEGAYIFSDIPIHALFWKQDIQGSKEFTLKELSHSKCITLEIDVFVMDYFIGKNVSVFFAGRNEWFSGTYILSCDFYTGNELLHLIKMETGNFARIPNHKINIDHKTMLTDYRKNQYTRSW